MRHRRRHAEVLHLRVGEHLVDAVDRAAGDAGALEQLHPVRGRLRAGDLGDGGVDRLAVGAAPLLGCPLRPRASRAGRSPREAPEHAAGTGGDVDGAVAVGNAPVGMPVGWSLPAWPATSPRISQRAAWKSSMNTCASSRLVVTQRPCPVRWRSNSAVMMPRASRLPAVRSAIGMPTRTGPWPGRPVIDIRPPMPLRDLVHAGARAIRAVLAEAADAAVDQARVDGVHVVPRDAQAVLHVGAHVLDQHVRLGRQPHEGGVPGRDFRSSTDGALVAVQVLEVRPVAVAGDVLAPCPAARRG